jgi:nitrite reductase/ring-hydroxylating ferredoxin subunit
MRLELGRCELPPGSRRLLTCGGLEVALFNVDGQIFALNNVCPHRGGPLIRGTIHASAEGPIVRCPMHGWPFHLASGASVRPGRATVYQVRILDETIEVETEPAGTTTGRVLEPGTRHVGR